MPLSDRDLDRWESGQPVTSNRQPLRRVPLKKPEPEYLTPKQIAAILGVSHMTIYRAIDSGHLRAHRILRSYRVHREDFEAFLDETATA